MFYAICEFWKFKIFEASKSLPLSRVSSEHRLPQKLSLGENKTLRGSSDQTEAGLPTNQSGFFRKSKNPRSSHGYREGTERRRFPCKVYYNQHGNDVERRGKPSTWLPRQKVAEERKKEKETKSKKSKKNRKSGIRLRLVRRKSAIFREAPRARESSPLQFSGAVTRLTVYRAPLHNTPSGNRPLRKA